MRSLMPIQNTNRPGVRKMSVIYAFLAVAGISSLFLPTEAFRQAIDNDFIRAIRIKLNAYNEQLPEDRIYLQLDKPLYEPGDDIWFSGYIRNAQTLKPSAQSEIVYVELISPKGTVEQKLNLIAKNGKVAGDFALGAEVPGGLYKLKAYTNWMKNESADNCFEKEIQIQDVVLPNLKMKLDFDRKAFGPGDLVAASIELNTNENKPLANTKIKYTVNINGIKTLEQTDLTDSEGKQRIKFGLPKDLKSNDGLLNVMIDYNGSTESISRSIPIVLNKIALSLFPEGGDLVSGLDNNVAFKALNEFGKPADIEGIVLTQKGSRVCTFSSYHQGMGAFKLNPQPGERYKVKITKPEGIKEEFTLPEALERGYVLNVDNSQNDRLNITVNSTETEDMSLVAQIRGKLVYATAFSVAPGTNTFCFATEKFPAGVCQVTIFDSKNIARAERLSFVNRDKQMNISIETEKDKYLPRDKVRMTISVKDERGLPMPANLSMAVVNDQLLSFADDKSGNIVSQMLLQQDLREKVEEPGFYFSKSEVKSFKALDYLLMTSGWRRFTWEKLIEQELPAIHFQPERTLIGGKVINATDNKPMKNTSVKSSDGRIALCDENGYFSFPHTDLSEPVTFSFSAEGFAQQVQSPANYGNNMMVYLYNNRYYELEVASVAVREDEVRFNKQVMLAPMAAMEVDERVVKSRVRREKEMHRKKSAEENIKHLEAVEQDDAEKPKLPLIANEHKEDQDKLKAEDLRFAGAARANFKAFMPNAQPATVYYRARQFQSPAYEKQQTVEARTDFRNTIYWNPNIEVGYSGKKTIEFYTSDDITSFRTTVEGISGDGSVGRSEKNFYTQLPFALSAKIPVEVATEDILNIPLILKNNTDAPIGGILKINAPSGLVALDKIPEVQTIMPGAARTILLPYKVANTIGEGELSLSFKACGLSDAFTQKVKIGAKGFPVHASFSSQEKEKEYSFTITNMVNGSLRASFSAYPNVVTDLLKGVEGILQEPYGCFEQTSCTAYPNAMVLDYLRHTDSHDTKTMARATDLLDRGYKRLTTFEASNKGYEWFGANPGHEGLTAYGIMEFVDMKKAGQNIDQTMLDRTARWLMNHKDGKGGFAREQHAYHDFGRISDDILNAYIVYALADAGYTDIKKEFESSYNKALSSKDPYMLAMIANAAFSMKENNKAKEALKVLVSTQQKDGSFTGSSHSITYSQGQSLTIETTALAIMAMLKDDNKNMNALNSAVHFLVSTRGGSGVFGSTQGTILALKSLTEFAKFSKHTKEDGTIVIYVDDKKVAEKSYKAGETNAIDVNGLEEYVKGEGKHTVKVKYIGVKDALPYSLAINWNTFLPASDETCTIDLKTTLATKKAMVGETVRLSTTISNKSSNDVPSTMAIIGIPAGLSAQPWQLKELQEKQVFDYYEIKGNNIAVYYRGMAPKAIKEINLDLKAEMPGEYDTPASAAYLYYTNEYKTWCAAGKVSIKKAE